MKNSYCLYVFILSMLLVDTQLFAKTQMIRYVFNGGNLQSAIDAASAGDIIQIYPGDYEPTMLRPGTTSEYCFYINKPLEIESFDVNNPATLLANQQGQINRVLFIDNFTGTGLLILRNLTIAGGSTTLSSPCATDGKGGGIYNKSTNLQLRNCIFQSNHAYLGGAIFNEHCSPKIYDCTFGDNHATDGVSIYNEASSTCSLMGAASPEIQGCIFSEGNAYTNSYTATHGIIFNNGQNGVASPTITQCDFQNNNGDVICNYAEGSMGVSSPTILGCIFKNNVGFSCVGYCGGTYDRMNAIHNIAIQGGNCNSSIGYNYFFENEKAICNEATNANSKCKPNIYYCTFKKNGDNAVTTKGGAVYSENTNGGETKPTISECKFIENEAYQGGAIYNKNTSPILTHCLFESNIAYTQGGAMYNEAESEGTSSPYVVRCSFFTNGTSASTIQGGAVYCYAPNIAGIVAVGNTCAPTFKKCIFYQNYAESGAAIVFNNGSATTPNSNLHAIISNSLFVANEGTLSIITNKTNNDFLRSPEFQSCTFYGNLVNTNFPVIANQSGYIKVINSILYGNAGNAVNPSSIANGAIVEYSYCDIQDAVSSTFLDPTLGADAGNNVFSVNPLFQKASILFDDLIGPDKKFRTKDDGLNLTCGSPLINMGPCPTPPSGPSIACTGTPGLVPNDDIRSVHYYGGKRDIGAYENKCGIIATVSINSTSLLLGANATVCPGANVMMQVYVDPYPYIYEWYHNGILIVGPSSSTYTISNINSSDSGYYYFYKKDPAINIGTYSDTIHIQVSSPTLHVNATATSCTNANTAQANVTVSNAYAPYTYMWSNGATTAAISGLATGTYSVAVTDSMGCTNTGSVTVAQATPIAVNITAPTSPIPSGSTVPLNATYTGNTGYTLANIPYNPELMPVFCAGPVGDDVIQKNNPIGFSFTYYGITYTKFGLSTNGNIQLGNGSGTANNPTYTTSYNDVNIPSAGLPNNMIALAWDDWLMPTGAISWGRVGLEPNRSLIVNFRTKTNFNSTDTLDAQIILREGSNQIEFHYTKKGTGNSTSTSGIESPAGTNGLAVQGRNHGVWYTNLTAVRFTPTMLTYSWSPSTFLSASNILNPVATNVTANTTYTLTVSDASGCVGSATAAINLIPAPVITGLNSVYCANSPAVMLTATPTGCTFTINGNAATIFDPSVLVGNNTVICSYTANGYTIRDTQYVQVNLSPTPSIVGLNNAYCSSDAPVTFMGNPVGGYFTVNGASVLGNPIVFDPSMQTGMSNFTYTYTDLVTGCSASTSQQTFVTFTPPTTIVGIGNTYCANAPIVNLVGMPQGGYFTLNGQYITVFNPSTAQVGTNTLVYTYPNNGCTTTTSQNVIVNSSPTVSISASGSTTFCAGNAPILTATATAGTGYTYSWVCNSGCLGATGQTFSPTASGNHRVIVTDANGCSASSPWLPISIKPLPNTNAGADKTICTNTATTIGVNASVGYIYNWSPTIYLSSASVANPTLSYTPVGTQTYTLTVTNPTTGCSKIDDVVVTTLAIPATPSLSASASPVCQGATITLTPSVTPSGALGTTLWYKNNGLIGSASSPAPRIISAVTPNTDSYTIKAKNGICLSNPSNPVSVMIKAAPTPTISATPAIVANVVSVCNPGQTSGVATLTVNAPIAATYSWQRMGGGATGVGTGAAYTASVATTPSLQNNKIFRVSTTYPNGCVKNSANVLVKMLPPSCSIRTVNQDDTDLATESLSIYPNPTDALLNISLENANYDKASLSLYNDLGQLLYEDIMTITDGKGESQIDISSLPSSIYTLITQTEGGIQTQKVVKE